MHTTNHYQLLSDKQLKQLAHTIQSDIVTVQETQITASKHITNTQDSIHTNDVLNNTNHITSNTKTPTGIPSTTHQQTSSPDIIYVFSIYNNTWCTKQSLSLDHLSIFTTAKTGIH